MFKLIWENIPKLLRKLLFPSVIAFPLITSGLYQYLIEGKLKYSESALQNFILFFSIYLIFIILFSVFISLIKIVYQVNNKLQMIEIKPEKSFSKDQIKIKKKTIPYEFELEVINYNFIEYTVLIKRRWLPTEEKPGVEDFLEAISFSKERCGECQSDFYVDYGSYNWYSCINKNCKNEKKIIENELFKYRSIAQTQYMGKIRNSYEKYWNTYNKIYDKFTNKNYEEYKDPV